VRDKLKRQEKSRVLLINSEGYRFAVWGIRLDDLNWEKRRYNGLGAYGASKIAQLLAMMVLDEYFTGSGVAINAMHPGAVTTETGKENGPVYRWFKRNTVDRISQSPQVSAEALYYLGVSRDIDGISGKFFHLTTEEEVTPPARDREEANELWQKSEELGGLK
jgi:NAD(P)-dependent dehydrogenase (short-subunit alcohol dehydrogenase family)